MRNVAPADEFDGVVVGGGIAGLTTALRLAVAGLRVLVLEREKLGSGATIGNHGTVHSGAFYAQLHPEITPQCQEAQQAYRVAFPTAGIPVSRSWYIGRRDRLAVFEKLWQAQGIAYQSVGREELKQVLRRDIADRLGCVAISDFVLSSRKLVLSLAQRCLDAGVQIATSTPAHEVMITEGRASGVRTGLREIVTTRQVVLCCGFGIGALAHRAGSSLRGCASRRHGRRRGRLSQR
jgi:glycine/D-amino acid oxidase-like deaminating enzyme